MTFRRTGYGLNRPSDPSAAWTHSWARANAGWGLRLLVKQRGEWVLQSVSAQSRLKARVFEPGIFGARILGTENRPLLIDDLARLSPLVEPREVLNRMLPGAVLGQHEVYGFDTPDGLVMIPAFTLIQCLWAWSSRALHALLQPNSLDRHLMGGLAADGRTLELNSALTSWRPTDLALDRVRWLAVADDARRSWTSVYLNASRGRIALELPHATLKTWLWGAQLPGGYLVCELCAPRVTPLCGLDEPTVNIGKHRYAPAS